MTIARYRVALGASLLAAACAAPTPASAPPAQPVASGASSPSAVPPVVAAVTPAPVAIQPVPRPCGALGCLAFATPQAAFEYVLASEPRVLAIGEAHAQQGATGIRSSTRRFAEELLPLLTGKAKHIVIELLVADCKQRTVDAVKKAQAPVTEHQAQSNQNEFLTLGKVAQRLGIEPQALAPSCPDYEAVGAAGEDGVAGLLTLVARETQKSVAALLAQPDSASEIVLTYGGALHNDLAPRPGQESWSFGPQLAAASGGHYVELDLIVPEFVKDTEAWRNLPWFGAFDREHLTGETLLYQPAAGSFALIFPKSEASRAQ